MKRRSTGYSSRGSLDALARAEASAGRKLGRAQRELLTSTVQALRAMEIEPSRSLGQNFLVDPAVADQEAALVDLAPGTPLVEIGGGLGELTRALVRRGFPSVTIIEKDPRLAGFLATNFKDPIRVIPGDALKVPFPATRNFVGNLPFSSATPILERLLSEGMEHGVFLIQKEVADRMSASPGNRDYGPLTVMTRIYGEFVVGARVPPESFFPPPQVSGALVIFRRAPLSPQPRDVDLLRDLLHGAFAWRRKMLRRSLPRVVAELTGREPPLAQWLQESGWPAAWAEMRAEEIPAASFVALSNRIFDARG